jgi:AcrR family transcriptional regulator
MVEIAEQTRRRRGRPQTRCDEGTRQLLIEAARQEFQANDYAGTCINGVAQRAGLSTKTMYRLIPNKADPQRAVMLGRRPVPGREEIVARAKQRTQLFLKGCIVRTGNDGCS